MRTISLTRGQVALVDDEDFERLNFWNWYCKENGNTRYAVSDKMVNRVRAHRLMHRVILNPPKELYIDHINHNGLDNRKENLRIVTKSMNAANMRVKSNNTTGHPGVYLTPARFEATITVDGKSKYLGRYKDMANAVSAYHEAKSEYFPHMQPTERFCCDVKLIEGLIKSEEANNV